MLLTLIITRRLLLPYAIRNLAGIALIPILVLVIACESGPLPQVDCGPNCERDYKPLNSGVEWLEKPTVSETGALSLKVRVGDDDHLTFPNQPGGGSSNIALTNGSGTLYGAVIPRGRWKSEPGFWVADEYRFDAQTLTVVSQIDARAANQRGLTLCLWTGGKGDANRILDCTSVERP